MGIIASLLPEAQDHTRTDQKALALEPSNATLLSGAAQLAGTLGHFEEALALTRRGVEVNPLDASAYVFLSLNASALNRLDEATAAIDKAQELNPQHPWLHVIPGGIYLAQSRPQEALGEMQKADEPAFRLYGLAIAYDSLKRKTESDAALTELIAKYQRLAAFQIAGVYALRGEHDQAFRWLDKAYVLRDPGLVLIKRTNDFKSLRNDPRYTAFLKKMQLPDS